MKMEGSALRFFFVVILMQMLFSINSYAVYERYVSLPSVLIGDPDIDEYVDNKPLNVEMNGQKLKLIVAKEHDTMIKGLSWRKKIPFDGMIFFFDKPMKISFWMRGMNFPIDIVWVSNNIVIGVTENAKPEPGVPEEDLKLYTPPAKVDIVIELSAGQAKQLNIKEGNILIL
ncbi:MAG: DUF192 domain-containing protein [Clostridiales Family XIII bacterium]|jgi:uncharacterized membrane protein (UPF0127 family)|nr:DUF192 domain-containing protein [Clostridiales Family XIII bacterium]